MHRPNNLIRFSTHELIVQSVMSAANNVNTVSTDGGVLVVIQLLEYALLYCFVVVIV